MTNQTEANEPVVTGTVTFPLIDRSVRVPLNKALSKVSTQALQKIADYGGVIEDSNVVHSILKSLVSEKEYVELNLAYADYSAEYSRLNRELRSHRGYGLDGDDEPVLEFSFNELLDWLKSHKPVDFEEALLAYVGPDVAFLKEGRQWAWEIRSSVLWILPTECRGRKSARRFPSRRKAVADLVAAVGLIECVTRHATGARQPALA